MRRWNCQHSWRAFRNKNASAFLILQIRLSRTISRVMSLNDHLSRTHVAMRLKRPTWSWRATSSLRSGLASDGVYMATAVTSRTVVSYTAFPPLPLKTVAVYFCCTGLGVTSTGRYPASCPVKPGLSSGFLPRPFILLNCLSIPWSEENFNSPVHPSPWKYFLESGIFLSQIYGISIFFHYIYFSWWFFMKNKVW